ncbi:Spc98 family-domain-containing protein [Pilobolus umbonatus]|nr:Spc98 family-domain-containing protein [Pilobolus umbonatus]
MCQLNTHSTNNDNECYGTDTFGDTSYSVKDIMYTEQPFKLKVLSDQPFDLLSTVSLLKHHDNTDMNQSAGSVTTASVSDRMEDDDIWTQSVTPPTSFSTLSWDTHHCYSISKNLDSEEYIGSPFLTEIPIPCFESITRTQSPIESIVIKEEHLARSLLHAIIGLPSLYFDWNQDSHTFETRLPFLRILGVSASAIQPIITKLLLVGTQLKLIEDIGNQCRCNPSRYGSIGVAFGCCMLELHINILDKIITVFDEMKDLSILKVYHHIHTISAVIDKLAQLCHINGISEIHEVQNDIRRDGYYIPSGIDLLNIFHDEIHQLDLCPSGDLATYRSICLAMFCYISRPYINILNEWLGLSSSGQYGDCGHRVDVYDPYGESFIQRSENTTDLLDEYEIRPDAKLPYFITKDMSVLILRSIISFRLLKRLAPHHPICHLKEDNSIRLILNADECERYLMKLEGLCENIRAYNIENKISVLNEDVPYVPSPEPEQASPDTEDSSILDMLTLKILGSPKLTTEFSDMIAYILSNPPTDMTNFYDFIPSFDTVIVQSYTKSLKMWCPLLNESFMTSFLCQFKLDTHLINIYNYYLCGDGRFITGLMDAFFDDKLDRIDIQVSKSHWPPLSSDLNITLKALLLEMNYDDFDMITFSINDLDAAELTSLGILDFLQLDYAIEYPIDIVITPSIEQKYNQLFLFLIRISRLSTTVKRCYKIMLCKDWFQTSTRDTIFRYRFQIHQFISAIQSYIHNNAVSSSWNTFMAHVNDMHTGCYDNAASVDYMSVIMEPHSLRDYHEHIIDRMLIQCFLKSNQKKVLDILYAIFDDILMFMTLLDNYYLSIITAEGEEKLLMKCRRIFHQFQTNIRIFVRVLASIDSKGYGSLSHLLSDSVFTELYRKHEAECGLDSFIQALFIHLQVNGFYDESI